ncbi:MAG TPA: hypothetical protein ENJ84_13875 [Gammaproteobacteria bacterium]|nr:hypothetical protein [Gammaproteobacteria bacterium]
MMARGLGLIALLFLVTTGFASDVSENGDERVSRSLEYFSDASPDIKSLQYAPVQVRPALVMVGYRAESGAGSPVAVKNHTFDDSCECSIPQITLFDADVSLRGDYDHDGYYTIFKVGFDADTDQEISRIYAEISLSLEGGPWNPVLTTKEIVLQHDAQSDEYVVETALDTGYPSGYYDLLIQFFESRNDVLLASYGPSDHRLFRALPLEDAQRDDTESVDYGYGVYGGGSLGGGVLLSLLGLARLRRFKGRRNHHSTHPACLFAPAQKQKYGATLVGLLLHRP